MNKTSLAAIISSISLALFVAVSAFASVQSGASSARGSEQPVNLFGDTGVFSQITNVLLFVIGAVSVIMIVIGGLRYVVSGGDAKQVDSAKNTILYAIIGIIVALLAYAAVGFVTSSFTADSQSDSTSTIDSGGGTSSGGSSTR